MGGAGSGRRPGGGNRVERYSITKKYGSGLSAKYTRYKVGSKTGLSLKQARSMIPARFRKKIY